MKIYRATAAGLFFAATTAAPLFAQRPATQPVRPGSQSAPQAAQTGGGAVPDTKIALVNSDAFFDDKQGISRLINAIKGVDQEFHPINAQLQQLQQKIEQAEADLKKVVDRQAPDINAKKSSEIDGMKKALQRQTEDAQANYQKKIREVLGPINDDIGRALDAFAKARGVTLVLDLTRTPQGMILSASDAMDITRAFIVEYNGHFK